METFGPNALHEGSDVGLAPAAALGQRHQRQAALHRAAHRVVDATKGLLPQTGFTRRVQADVAALFVWNRQATHHHGQHIAQSYRGSGEAPQRKHARRGDRGVGAAKRKEEVDGRRVDQGDRRSQVGLGCKHQARHAGPLRTQGLQAALQVVQAVQAPVPLAAVVQHGPQVMAQLLAQGVGSGHVSLGLLRAGLGQRTVEGRVGCLICNALPQRRRQRPGKRTEAAALSRSHQHALGPRSGGRRGLGAGIVEVQPVMLRQTLRILPAVGLQAVTVRRCSVRGRAYHHGLELDLITLQQCRQAGGQQRTVGVVHLMEVQDPVRLAARTPAALESGAGLQQAVLRQPVLGDGRHQQAA